MEQSVINKLADTLTDFSIELDRLRDVASNAPLAIERASAGMTADNLAIHITALEATLDSLNFI